MAQTKRVTRQPAFVLRRRPYSESSLLLDIFSRQYGLQIVLAKGARRLKSNYRGVLHPFQSLTIGWSGRRELMTLTQAEMVGYQPALGMENLKCGFYANELLLRFLHRGDPHEELFDQYALLLGRLYDGLDADWSLRLFEKAALADIGYGLVLDHEVLTNRPIQTDKRYLYVPDKGPINADNASFAGVSISGQALTDLLNEKPGDRPHRSECKRLMQVCLQQHLNAKPLQCRKVFRQVAKLREGGSTESVISSTA